jgi:hypothetical protein
VPGPDPNDVVHDDPIAADEFEDWLPPAKLLGKLGQHFDYSWIIPEVLAWLETGQIAAAAELFVLGNALGDRKAVRARIKERFWRYVFVPSPPHVFWRTGRIDLDADLDALQEGVMRLTFTGVRFDPIGAGRVAKALGRELPHANSPRHEGSLATTGDMPVESPQRRGGRPPKEWWDDLWCAIWGQVYRGDLQPKSQADIERAMLKWVEAREERVSESTLKPLARKMYVEMQR